VQTISWGQSAGEAGVLSDLCGGGALHGSEVYLTGVSSRSGPALEGFLVIKKKKKKKLVSKISTETAAKRMINLQVW
jgi:hypothetical protein